MLSMADDAEDGQSLGSFESLDDLVIAGNDAQSGRNQDAESSATNEAPRVSSQEERNVSSRNQSTKDQNSGVSVKSSPVRRRSTPSKSSSRQDQETTPRRSRRKRPEDDSKSNKSQDLVKAVHAAIKQTPPKSLLPDQSNDDEGDDKKNKRKSIKPNAKAIAGKIAKHEKVLNKNKENDTKPAIDATRQALIDLGQLQVEEAVPVITEYLSDSRRGVAEFACRALGETKSPTAFEPLAKRLIEVDAEACLPVLNALGQLGDRRAVRPLIVMGLEHPQLGFRATDSIVALGKSAVPSLIEIAESGDPGEILSAVVALGKIKDKRAIEVLSAIVQQQSPMLRCHAAEALGEIGDSKGLKALALALEDEDSNVRVNAASAMLKIPDERMAKPLIKALSDTDPQVRMCAAITLGNCGDKSAVPHLVKLLDEDDGGIVVAACESLGKLGDKTSVNRLIELLVPPEEGQDPTILSKTIDSIRRIRTPEAVPALLDLLDTEDPVIRQKVVEAIGQCGDPRAAEHLEQVMAEDRAEEVRAAAAKALGELGDPESAAALEQALQDTFNIRVKAVISMGQLKVETLVPTLTRLLKDQSPEIRFHSALAIAEIGHEKSVHQILPLVADDNAMVKRGALKAIQKLGDERSEKELIKAAKKRAGATTEKKKANVSTFSIADYIPAEIMTTLVPDSPRGKAIAGGVAGGVTVLLLLIAFFFAGGFSTGYKGPRGGPSSISFYPNSEYIAVGRSKGLLEIWKVTEGRKAPYDWVEIGKVNLTETVCVTDQLIWTSMMNSIIRVEGGSVSSEVPVEGKVKRMRLSADKSKLIVQTEQGSMYFFDPMTGAAVGTPVAVGAKEGTPLAISADASLIVLGGNAKITLLTGDGKPLLEEGFAIGKGKILSLGINSDGRTVAVCDSKGLLHIVSVDIAGKTAELVKSLKPDEPIDLEFVNVEFLPDGKSVALISKPTFIFQIESETSTPIYPQFAPYEGSISEDGKYAAFINDEDSAVYVYDVSSGQELFRLDKPARF